MHWISQNWGALSLIIVAVLGAAALTRLAFTSPRLAIVITSVLAIGATIYFGWGTLWLEFVGLSLLYLIVASAIIYATAMYYHAEPEEYFRDNNTWFLVLVGATALTFVIACFNFGPAVLLPEKVPTPEQRGWVSNTLNHLWLGKNAPPVKLPTKPLPWATGTWFWWKATLIFFLLTFGYFWFAFWDEATHAVHFVVRLVHERWEEHRARQRAQPVQTGQQTAGQSQPTRQGTGFWQFVKWDLILELAIAGFKEFFLHRRRATT
jgi:hypothetical protein